MVVDRYMSHSPNTFVLIDANNDSTEWEGITHGIRAWMLAVGDITPKYCEEVQLEKGDLALLLSKARIMVSDRDLHKALCAKYRVPLVLINELDPEAALVAIDRRWNG